MRICYPNNNPFTKERGNEAHNEAFDFHLVFTKMTMVFPAKVRRSNLRPAKKGLHDSQYFANKSGCRVNR